jgi:hypothetical protein
MVFRIFSGGRRPRSTGSSKRKHLAPQVGFGSKQGIDSIGSYCFYCNASNGFGQKWPYWTTDLSHVTAFLRAKFRGARLCLRAWTALLQLAKGVSAPRISASIPLTPQAIRKVGHRYQEAGLERAIYERQRPGAAEVLDDNPGGGSTSTGKIEDSLLFDQLTTVP